ncbi:helix-turn-helix transcriptional regulator [Bowdeniella nasicola]|uniref:helix-turn-helix transcriptional regulator n=1 Tax=Bowdeniella nasicola TaxID=208480 RepID=UPI001FE7FEB6|nr:histidine kinase [Bowdeniella nasicola]
MRGEQPLPSALGYFFTLLALGTALVILDDSFVIFLITGFFHAHILASWRVGLFGIFVTSLVINGVTLLGRPTISTQDVAFAGMIIVVQTAAIGAGLVITLQAVKAEEKRDELVARLQAALDENAGLHAQLVVQAREAGVHDERGRLAREIHDTIAQGLAGVITQLHAAQGARDQQDSAARVESALLFAKSSLDEASRSVKALQPRELGQAQLPDALRTLAATWQETNEVPVHVEITAEPVALSPALDVSLFRVSQEALTNVAKHAQASRIALTLSYGDRPGRVVRYSRRRARNAWADKRFPADEHAAADPRNRWRPGHRVRARGGHNDKRFRAHTYCDSGGRIMIRLLIVDDHPIVRSGLRGSFSNLADIVVVGEASNGEEDVKLAVQLAADVVLMDLRMPILGGVQATEGRAPGRTRGGRAGSSPRRSGARSGGDCASHRPRVATGIRRPDESGVGGPAARCRWCVEQGSCGGTLHWAS